MDFRSVHACPACGGTALKTHVDGVRGDIPGTPSFRIAECGACGIRTTDPAPTEEAVPALYDVESYLPHASVRRDFTAILYRLLRSWNIRKKTVFVERLASPGRLLDIGCGAGHFLAAMQRRGWEVGGVEPSDASRAGTDRMLGGGRVYPLLDSVPGGPPWRVITLWHALEHMPRLNDVMTRVATLLETDGFLVVAVPNCDSPDSHRYGREWAAYDAPRHLYHFTPAAMRAFLSRHGFAVVGQTGLRLDAYYISLLSEKIRHSAAAPFRAAARGWLSNREAARTGGYSSIIYVATRNGARVRSVPKSI